MAMTYRTSQIQYYMDYAIEHCILAVAFFLPLSLNVTTIFLAAGTLCWVVKMAATRCMSFRPAPFDAVIALLVALSAISICFSPDREFSFYNYYNLMGRYILIYYLVVNNICSLQQIKRLVYMMLAAAFVVALYGFYQYIYGVDISAFQWVDGDQFPDLKMRVFSTLKNPNLLAGFLVTMMSIAAGLGFYADRVKDKILLFGLVIVLGTCLVFTYSRGAWLSILVVIAAYGFICNRKLLWLLLIIPLAVFVAHDAVMERLMSILNPTDTSSTLRLALWESTLAMIADKPFFGIGWGAYWLVYPHYDFFIGDSAGTKIFHAHNMYLNIAAEIGIPGLLAFLTMMTGHARMAVKLLATAGSRWISGLMLGVVTALLGLAVSGFTDYILFNIQMSMLFWLLNALVVAVWQLQTHQQCGMIRGQNEFWNKKI